MGEKGQAKLAVVFTCSTAEQRDGQYKDSHDKEDLRSKNETAALRNAKRRDQSNERESFRREERRSRDEKKPGEDSKEVGGRWERRGSRTDRFKNERMDYAPSQLRDTGVSRKMEGRFEVDAGELVSVLM